MIVPYRRRHPRSRARLALAASLGIVLWLGCHIARDPKVTVPPAADAKAPAAEPDWTALAAERLPQLSPCDLPNVPEETLLCGTLSVPENRADPDGRTISLRVVVVPAQQAEPPADPVFVLEGGPGGAATRRARGSIYAGPVRARDIVLVDQRGTGDSNPLHCPWDETFQEGALHELFPRDRVEACARKLGARADVALYTTDHFADDLEDVRRWLGYGRLNLRGGSYGTWAMMVFAQRYPESVRTMFGIGLDSPLRSNLAERGVWTERTLERLGAMCARDPACNALTPDFAASTSAAIAMLGATPRRVVLDDPAAPGTTLEIEVGRDWLTEQLRLLLYFAFTSRALPWAVHQAHGADDWRPLVALAVSIERNFRGALAHGIVLTVQCSEMMDFDVAAARERGAATLVGNYRLDQAIQGCDAWPHTKKTTLDREMVLPVPTMLLSGALDPVTPPEYGEDVRTVFPNSHHLVLAEGQHGPFDLEGAWECVHAIWGGLLERGTVEDLDTRCAADLKRPAFLTDGEAFWNYLRETLVEM